MMPAAATEGAAWNLCIDFGTAYCKAAAAPAGAGEFAPEQVRPLALGAVFPSGNPLLLESAVFIDSGAILFGQAATLRAAALAATKRQALRSFKTILSAEDLESAIEMAAPLSIDPHRAFRQRDLLVLFLAFLSEALARAIAADPALAGQTIRMRYSLPFWRKGSARHDTIRGLFASADQVRRRLGDALLAEAGVPIETARNALKSVDAAARMDMGMIHEATAAAYTAIGGEKSAKYLLVVDMGAGTTDFAALRQNGAALQEVLKARFTLMQAGDAIDRILLDLALRKADLKTTAAQAELWRTLTASIRDVKESLFHDGKAAIAYKGKIITLNRAELERDRDFKILIKEIRKVFDQSLSALAARAATDKNKEIAVVAAGGGAATPFIQDMLRHARAPQVRVRAKPPTPQWAHAAAHRGNLAAVFPQLAIAIGGALAPEALLSAK
jgi:molecular chaperone DnaK (HSP70)